MRITRASGASASRSVSVAVLFSVSSSGR